MRAFRDMSIQRRLLWLPLLSIGVALLLATTAFTLFEWNATRQERQERLETITRVIGANVSAALVFDDTPAADAVLGALEAEPRILSACVYRTDGTLFASYRRAEDVREAPLSPPTECHAVLPPDPTGGTLPERALVHVEAVFAGAQRAGTVVVRHSNAGVWSRVRGFLVIAGIVLSFSAGVAALIAASLRRTVARPILQLVQTARRVSQERDYAVRVAPGGDDELGRLVNSFNEMLEQIQSRDRTLEQARDLLDDEVKRRTAALESAVDDLRDEIQQRERAEARVRELAYYDPVTALPNRQLLLERLEGALAASRESGRPTALLFLDLDRFKEINDSLGHPAGDELLEQVAGRLVHCVRGADHVARPDGEDPPPTVSRQGGDEFTVLLTRLRSTHDATRVCKRILDALTEPFSLGEREVVIGASIGVAVFPHDGDDAETLIKHADTAMYQAKANGRNDYQYFSESMKAAAIERINLEGDLRRAIVDQQLHVEYQPMFRIADGRIAAVEALLRWRHPTRGSVPPEVFVPIAEDCGLIVPIGEWVLGEAVHQCELWRRGHAELAELEIGVNVSFRQFRKGRLLEATTRILHESGLPPHALMLEMTETTMLSGETEAVETLERLKELGVRVALDDFGTGYSSLSHLRRLPLDSLKIDRSFVTGIDDDSESERIVTAVIAMGHGLGLRVVAEGIDREAQLELLQERGCDLAQGFLLSPPVAPEAVPGIARTAKRRT